MTDWESLVDESTKQPIWEGDIELDPVPGSLWWQTWDTGRMDIGTRWNVTAMALKRMGVTTQDEIDELAEQHRTLVVGMVGSLVAPALEEATGDWSVEVKMPVATEKESSAGRPYWHLTGKVIVRCAVAKELELLINAVNRFALDSGWDGKTSRERWAMRARP